MKKGVKKEKPKVDLECGPAQLNLYSFISFFLSLARNFYALFVGLQKKYYFTSFIVDLAYCILHYSISFLQIMTVHLGLPPSSKI